MALAMSSPMSQPIFGKRRAHDGSEQGSKRVRLDKLLSKLSLEPETSNENPATIKSPSLDINPLLDFTDEERKPKSTIDLYISERLIATMQEKAKEGLAVGRWYIPAGVVILHFQRWVRRLFNNFVRRYNALHPDRPPVSQFKNYSKIVKLVTSPDVNFTIEDLRQILADENAREQYALLQRRQNRESKKHIEEIKEENSIFAGASYNYWDRFSQVNVDFDMELSADASDGLDLDMMDI